MALLFTYSCVMTADLLLALFAFAFVSSITPGPNNLMLMASGVNFGFVRTMPHMAGIGIGFALMIACVGAGIMGLFEVFPIIETGLMALCVVYLLYLAWKIAAAAPPGDAQAGAKPFTFLQAAAFQWVNPKAWAMALTAMSVYAPSRSWINILIVAGIFACIALVSTTSWTGLGKVIRRLLSNPTHLRLFNIAMAVLLVSTLIPVFLH